MHRADNCSESIRPDIMEMSCTGRYRANPHARCHGEPAECAARPGWRGGGRFIAGFISRDVIASDTAVCFEGLAVMPAVYLKSNSGKRAKAKSVCVKSGAFHSPLPLERCPAQLAICSTTFTSMDMFTANPSNPIKEKKKARSFFFFCKG